MEIRLTNQKDVDLSHEYVWQIYGGTITFTGKELLRLQSILEAPDEAVEEVKKEKPVVLKPRSNKVRVENLVDPAGV